MGNCVIKTWKIKQKAASHQTFLYSSKNSAYQFMQDKDTLNIWIFMDVQLQKTFTNDKVWMGQICQGF